MALPPPICVKLPQDLDTAVRVLAEAQGISVSELLRTLLAQVVYGHASSVDDGYLAARRWASRLAHHALRAAINALPEDHDQAMAIFGGYQGPVSKE